MKLILLLAALLIVGLLVNQQLNQGTAADAERAAEASGGSQVPEVPTKPEDVPQFEKDMNSFMEDEAAKQQKQLDQATQ